MRLLSLGEGVEPLIRLFHKNNRLRKVWIVKEQCKESTSIMFYTLGVVELIFKQCFTLNVSVINVLKSSLFMKLKMKFFLC